MHHITAAMTATLAMTAPLAAETHHIEITDGAFIPASITVAPGDTIIWTATTIGATIVSGSDCMPEGDFFWGAVPNGGGDGPPNMTFAWNVPAITTEIPYMCIAHCGMGMTGNITIGAAGTTIHVPGDYTTIQAAIDAASDGDAIAIAAGTYAEHDLTLGAKGITMTGATNAEGEPAVIIDAQQQGRVMTISGESASGLAPLIEHIAFTGGSSQSPGGGMNCTNSNAFIRNCHFIDNVSDMNGGGVYHSGQAAGPPPDAGVSATFTRCLFTGNTADEGGGMHGRLGHTKLTNCIVTNNTATTGGGLSQCACKYAAMSVSSSTVCGNSPDQIDGPIALDWGSCASPWCEDTDGDGSPDGCLNDNDGMLHVPDEYATIQMAFKSAVDGDTIVIAAGTYLQEEGDELEMTNGMSLSIIGETHSDGTPAATIDGQGLTTGIMFFGGTDASGAINIENLHLTRFLYPLSLNNCSASVMNCALDTNYGYFGVISIINSHATVKSCTVTGNQGTFAGGVQVVDNNGTQSSEVSLIDCVIEGNIGTYPYYAIGGVSLYNGHTSITGCTISDNTSTGLGGVFVDASATVAIDDTTVCGNVGYENDTTQISGDFTDNGGNCIQDDCDDCADCPGDLDGSGTVDVSDLLLVIGSWGDPYDVKDLLLVISLWGNSCT
jgi:plastocyanin